MTDAKGDKGAPTEDPIVLRQRQKRMGEQLRAYYSRVASEPVPSDFLDLLDEADAKRRDEDPA